MSNYWPEGYGYENQIELSILDHLLLYHDISSSTLAAVLGCSQIQLWKIEKNVKSLPPHYKSKLEKFLEYLEQKQRFD